MLTENLTEVFMYKQKNGYGCKERHFVAQVLQLLCLCVLSCPWQNVPVFTQQCRMLDAVCQGRSTYSVEVALPRCGLMPHSQLSQMHTIHDLL